MTKWWLSYSLSFHDISFPISLFSTYLCICPLKPGYFSIVMKLLILFTTSSLSGFLWHALARKSGAGRHCIVTARLDKSLHPSLGVHWPLTGDGGFSLLLGRAGSSSSLVLRHYTTPAGMEGVLFFFKYFNFIIVDLQCCVSFRCTAKWFSYTYTYIHSFSDSFLT